MVLENLKIDRKSNKSASSQLTAYFRNKIITKQLSPGDRLPTTTDLVKNIKVGASTVREAMSNLVKEGLVEATPGKGTYVSESISDMEALLQNGIQNTLKKVCVIGAFNPANEGGWYKRLLMSGIIKQSHCFGTDVVTLGREFQAMDANKAIEKILQLGCDGCVWLLPEPEHWPIIEKLEAVNIPFVVARNSHGNDGYASIEIDYEGVGFEAGHHFIDQQCDRIVLFTRNKQDIIAEMAIKHGVWPSNIYSGFCRSIFYFKPSSENSFLEIPLGGDYRMAATKLNGVLEECSDRTGLFFVDPIHLASYILSDENVAIKKLKKHKISMISNTDNYNIFAPYCNELDLHMFMECPEQVGTLSIQKLKSVLDGHLENTVTSIRLEIEKYDSKKSIKRLVDDAKLRSNKASTSPREVH